MSFNGHDTQQIFRAIMRCNAILFISRKTFFDWFNFSKSCKNIKITDLTH